MAYKILFDTNFGVEEIARDRERQNDEGFFAADSGFFTHFEFRPVYLIPFYCHGFCDW
jgi:hypothetical protein